MKTQNWTDGSKVSVGFVKNLTVEAAYNDGSFGLISSNGERYTFSPSGDGLARGLFRWS